MKAGIRICGLALGAWTALATATEAADHDAIAKAVDRGVQYLQQLQGEDGAWPTHQIGATALAGLTLLECGVPATDPAVQKAAKVVRQAIINLEDEHGTYCLSLAILFFDRLGDAGDVPLIESLAVRLLAGQNPAGGWTYECPKIGEDEVRRLRNLLKQRTELVAQELPRKAPRSRQDLPKEIQQQLARIEQRGPAHQAGLDNLLGGGGDNSNTQFAILALWVAQRHGLPVEQALARTEARFRNSQQADGGWGYMPALQGATELGGLGGSTPAMTCAGLLGLAMGHGSALLRTEVPAKTPQGKPAKPGRDPARDPAIRAGLLALGTVIGKPAVKGARPGGEAVVPKDFYFAWSLERVAVAYGLTTMDNKNWYDWGSEIILDAQLEGGGWKGKHGADVDTCFALLFLRRSNLTRDLTTVLRDRVRDPGTVTLKVGGVGGQPLGKEAKPGPGRGDNRPEEIMVKEPPVPRKDKPIPAAPAPKNDSAEVARLSGELVQALGKRQEQVLTRFKESKGTAYTQALASAIPRLEPAERVKVRDALAERLMGMTAATLRDKLSDEDVEIRRAAALACGMKEDLAHVPDLILLLNDGEPMVVRAAHAALKNLTKQDFGPAAAGASRAERAEAMAAWTTWWQKKRRGP